MLGEFFFYPDFCNSNIKRTLGIDGQRYDANSGDLYNHPGQGRSQPINPEYNVDITGVQTCKDWMRRAMK